MLRRTSTLYSSMLWLSYFGSGSNSLMPLAALSATRIPASGADKAMPDMSRAIDPVLVVMKVSRNSPRKCDMRQMGDKILLLLAAPAAAMSTLPVLPVLLMLPPRPPRFARCFFLLALLLRLRLRDAEEPEGLQLLASAAGVPSA